MAKEFGEKEQQMLREKEALEKEAESRLKQMAAETELKLREKALEVAHIQQITQEKDSEIERLRQAEKRQRDELLHLQQQLREIRLAPAQSDIFCSLFFSHLHFYYCCYCYHICYLSGLTLSLLIFVPAL